MSKPILKHKGKRKRTRKWRRAIIKNGKIIATPTGMMGKYRAYPLLWERQREVFRRKYGW